MALKRVTAPATDPVTLDEAKAQVREDSSDFDTEITAFIKAATGFVEGPKGYLGRALIDQTWDYYLDAFPCWDTNIRSIRWGQWISYIEIPLPPLIEVAGVFYTDTSGVEQTFDPAFYTVDTASEPGRIALKSGASWPTLSGGTVNAVRIRFRAGYLDTSSPPVAAVPYEIKAGILLYIADLYQNRENSVIGETAVELPFAAKALLKPHRIPLSMA